MDLQTIQPPKSISLFVKNIWSFEEKQESQKTILPFFADGYPGLMFQETANGLWVSPHNKKMPSLFLYGQTIKPIELHMEGRYKLIVFQLYPFVLKSFFNVEAKDVNDNCYDLQQLENGGSIIQQLSRSKTKSRIDILTNLLLETFESKKQTLDFTIRQAIQIILDNNGQFSIARLSEKIHLTQRTFERRFQKETGLSPKQFSQVIQFQKSFEQFTLKEYNNLTDIVYANGFSDQSHFIRVFKAFTGKTPKKFPV
ncbi:MAG: AraC family transcriptional regulator [Agriterribacter sp.]